MSLLNVLSYIFDINETLNTIVSVLGLSNTYGKGGLYNI